MDLFLLILAVALAVTAGVTVLAVRREHAAIRGAASEPRLRDLGPYELAFMAGGSRRVAEAAVGLLAASGAVRVSRDGRVHQVAGARSTGEPVEDAVLDEVQRSPGGWASTIRHSVSQSATLDELRHRLGRIGAIHPTGSFTQVDRLIVRLRVLAVLALAGAAVEALSVAVEGTSALPLAALGVLAGTVVGAPTAIAGHRRSFPTDLTASGQAALDRAKLDHPPGTSGGPVAVALYGLGELNDANLTLAINGSPDLTLLPGRRRRSGPGGHVQSQSSGGHGGGCGTTGCGGGSGCGGGGCGGGGCGGGGS
ncbi:TIGR04222 domain-containing membrane protein [Nonomuraea sp. NPDC047529]|uniref:TIGR04222 domain-containing membrane protein n=1 Tax=Nonomuraea sp. NPDC047529 TaxID=3155623 RepID=UPI0033ECA03C